MRNSACSPTGACHKLRIWRLRDVPALLLLAASIAYGGEMPHCNPEGSGPEINACAREDFARADRELNRIYKALKARQAGGDRTRLVADQRAWLKERDPACRLLLKEDEGYTIWPSEFDNCRAEASRERTAQLRAWKTSPQK